MRGMKEGARRILGSGERDESNNRAKNLRGNRPKLGETGLAVLFFSFSQVLPTPSPSQVRARFQRSPVWSTVEKKTSLLQDLAHS